LIKGLSLFFPDNEQLISIPVSFLSLTIASNQYFFYHRRGQLPEFLSTLRMNLLVMTLNFLLISGPLFTTVILAYLDWMYAVILLVIITIIIGTFTQKVVKMNISHTGLEVGKTLYKSGNEDMMLERPKSECLKNFFTSWLAPRTVWENNFCTTPKHLLLLSSLTPFCQFITLSIFIFAFNNSTVRGQSILHCIETGNQSVR